MTQNTVTVRRRFQTASAGFTVAELLVLVAVISILCAIGFPLYLSYSRAQETDGAARVIVVALNQARQLAVTRGGSYSVDTQTAPNNRVRFFCTNAIVDGSGNVLCAAGTVWTGAGTDGSGWHRLENAARIVQAPAITFSSLGGATIAPAGTAFRVQNSSATGTLDVCVSPSGRIKVQATGAPCP